MVLTLVMASTFSLPCEFYSHYLQIYTLWNHSWFAWRYSLCYVLNLSKTYSCHVKFLSSSYFEVSILLQGWGGGGGGGGAVLWLCICVIWESIVYSLLVSMFYMLLLPNFKESQYISLIVLLCVGSVIKAYQNTQGINIYSFSSIQTLHRWN